jgi:Uma2 family endonuclease
MAVRHAFTVDEWHRMGEAGLFGEDARMELLDGEVIEMAPLGSPHAGCVNRLNRLFTTACASSAVIAVQNPVVLDDRSEPQPDVAVLAPRADEYARSHATPAEILLLIEVSDTTLRFDRDRKAPYYAGAGVRECWVVDLEGDQLLVMRAPSPGGYRDRASLGRGQRVGVEALAGVEFDVGEILGPP